MDPGQLPHKDYRMNYPLRLENKKFEAMYRHKIDEHLPLKKKRKEEVGNKKIFTEDLIW